MKQIRTFRTVCETNRIGPGWLAVGFSGRLARPGLAGPAQAGWSRPGWLGPALAGLTGLALHWLAWLRPGWFGPALTEFFPSVTGLVFGDSIAKMTTVLAITLHTVGEKIQIGPTAWRIFSQADSALSAWPRQGWLAPPRPAGSAMAGLAPRLEQHPAAS